MVDVLTPLYSCVRGDILQFSASFSAYGNHAMNVHIIPECPLRVLLALQEKMYVCPYIQGAKANEDNYTATSIGIYQCLDENVYLF